MIIVRPHPCAARAPRTAASDAAPSASQSVSCPPPAVPMVTQSATILERHLLLGQGPTQMPAHKAAAAFAFPGAAGAVAFAAGLAAAAVSGKTKRKRLVKEVRYDKIPIFEYLT